MGWQRKGLTSADGPQSHGEFAEALERHVSPDQFAHLSLLAGEERGSITSLEVFTLKATACHRQ